MKRKYQEMFKKIKEGDVESLSYILATINKNYKILIECNYLFERRIYGKFLKEEKEELLKETLELIQKLNKLKLKHGFVTKCFVDKSIYTFKIYVQIEKKLKMISKHDYNETVFNDYINEDVEVIFSLTEINSDFMIDELLDFNKELASKSYFKEIFVRNDKKESIFEEEKKILINAGDFHDKTEEYKATKFYALILGRELTTVENDLIASMFKKTGLSVEIWEGEIEDLFSEKNYSKTFSVGTLSGSCMRYDKCRPWLEFYKHVNGVKGIVIKDKDGGVVARALLQEMDNGEFILDRQYGKESIKKQMNEWAKKNGYGYIYYAHGYDCESYFKDGEKVKLKNRYLTLNNTLENREAFVFPYLDNFSKLVYEENEWRLYSSATDIKTGFISLKNHQSSYNVYGKCEECGTNMYNDYDKPTSSPTNILEKGLFMNVHGKGIKILCKKCSDKKELYEGEFYNKEDMPKCQKCGKHSFNLTENNGIQICKTCEDSLITCDCGKRVFESDLEFNDDTLEFDKCVYCI